MSMFDRRVAETFVQLSDTSMTTFDLMDFLNLLTRHCVELLAADAAGLLLTDQEGFLNTLAATGDQVRLVELLELQTREGPCVECFAGVAPVYAPDLRASLPRWPRFAGAALETGFASVYALPMRLREECIGALCLFGIAEAALGEDELALGQAMAHVSTIGLLNERACRRREATVEQLQSALDSRVVIEQAKGALAERRRISVDDAFDVLRQEARSHNLRLVDVAQAVVESSHAAQVLARTRTDRS